MNEHLQVVADRLAGAPMCFIATTDNGAPRVRPFQYQFTQDGKLWFCTAKSKAVSGQLRADPRVEICVVGKDMGWLRVSGRVVFSDDRAVKERILNGRELIKKIYGSADNPDFAVFYLEHGEYTLADFSGNPPRQGIF